MINLFIFADELVLFASCQQNLQHAVDKFSAACDQGRMKTSTKKTKMMCLFRDPRQCMLLAAVNSKGEEVQVFGVVLTSDRR